MSESSHQDAGENFEPGGANGFRDNAGPSQDRHDKDDHMHTVTELVNADTASHEDERPIQPEPVDVYGINESDTSSIHLPDLQTTSHFIELLRKHWSCRKRLLFFLQRYIHNSTLHTVKASVAN